MRTLIKVLAAMLVLGFSLPAKSMLAYVDDSVLDSMRGRYVDAGQIVRFGVQMLSTWQNAAGVVQGAGVQLSAQAGAVPVIHRYTLNSTSATNHAVSSMPAGLASVQGTVQINQQAGNGNISRNITRVDIDDGAARSACRLDGRPARRVARSPMDSWESASIWAVPDRWVNTWGRDS
ncbi:Uncharacterised protein [Chromobacterium violaceum]|uniref:Uncharacterized protein n=1 Tax=Chromobacterium violaceum TaxID=536 RepID=A0A3S4HF78_CHRVL|nr:Uncharacterised protein [Chromobacterium violaceum]